MTKDLKNNDLVFQNNDIYEIIVFLRMTFKSHKVSENNAYLFQNDDKYLRIMTNLKIMTSYLKLMITKNFNMYVT